jgi:hypothetical protein
MLLSNRLTHISSEEGRQLIRNIYSLDIKKNEDFNLEFNAWNVCLYCKNTKDNNTEMVWVKYLRSDRDSCPNAFCSETCLNIYILQNNNK